jgi:hypothetical protein
MLKLILRIAFSNQKLIKSSDGIHFADTYDYAVKHVIKMLDT